MKIKRLSVVIPAYNEIKTIRRILEEVDGVNLRGVEKEVVIIDDGSSDGTREVLRKLPKKYVVEFHKENRGKSAAVKTGLLKTTGDLVIVQDADLEYDPNDYLKMLKPFERAEADVVYGSRFKGEGPHRMIYFSNMIANKFLTFLSNLFTGYNLSDMETCYKMFRGDLIREIAPTLTATRFGFEPEVTAKLSKRKVKLYEVGISYYGRTIEEGKHIRFRDGLKAIWEIIKYNKFSKTTKKT
ncbi:MAG: glycosyltransferase family 2 protein [Patescibacteria group bacterium]|nr:glycosyltransferase family 2 protein [Patescibacteria group bacterium]